MTKFKVGDRVYDCDKDKALVLEIEGDNCKLKWDSYIFIGWVSSSSLRLIKEKPRTALDYELSEGVVL